MIQTKNINWFYAALILFMVALPFSEALISIAGVLLLITAFISPSKKTFAQRFQQNKELLIFSSIYSTYLIGLLFTSDFKWALYDLQKNIPYLIIPFAFIIAPQLSRVQLVNLLKIFVVAVSASALITMISFYSKDEVSVLKAQEFGFIHHIRFSFQLVFSMIIVSVFLYREWRQTKGWLKLARLMLLCFLFLFLLWHQSFTGLLTFLVTAFVGFLLFISQIKNSGWKIVGWIGIALIIIVPGAYLINAVNRFYDVDQIEYAQIDQKTALGNPYHHDFQNKQIENGHYVGLYWNEAEMKEAWNNHSNIKYDENGGNGYQIKYTLVRYLTSKNLRKDAAGVEQLSDLDIHNIEAGISNYILAEKGISLYPRIYTSIWELDTYFRSGYANQKSLAQRIEYAKAAFTIIKANFWFGVGTGNWKTAYREAYQKNHSQMDPARYGDAHNQYLNYMVKFGLIGLLWILFAIVYPVVKSRSYRNPIFFLFLISMLVANFGDSNFETHVGSSFFVLFYCLFISFALSECENQNQLI